jgi:hypothetical protein
VNVEVADVGDQHDFGTDWLAEFIRGAGSHYRDNYLATHPGASVIAVNDASLPQGGDTPDHSGHETGLSCDLRLPRTDGTTDGGLDIGSPLYDKDAARAILQAFRTQVLFSRAFFNDSTLIEEGLCVAATGHDNHIHVEIRAPERA